MAKKKAVEAAPEVVKFATGDKVKFELNGEWVDATVMAVSVVGDEGTRKYTLHHSAKVLTQYVPQEKVLPADAEAPAPAPEAVEEAPVEEEPVEPEEPEAPEAPEEPEEPADPAPEAEPEAPADEPADEVVEEPASK